MKGFRSPVVESWLMHDSTHDVYTYCVTVSPCYHKCVALCCHNGSLSVVGGPQLAWQPCHYQYTPHWGN